MKSSPKAPARPALRYHGGKWKLAPWIIEHLPPHRIYVEPFGGAASVLLRKPRAHTEVYSDLGDDVVNLFRVLRDPEKSEQLQRAIALTPFARVEFDQAYEATPDPVESARRLVARSFMGYGSTGTHAKTGFRNTSSRSGTGPAMDWRNFAPAVAELADRMRGVVVEQRPALDLIDIYDEPQALFYIDPPYVHQTRGQASAAKIKNGYLFELTDDDHRALAERLHRCTGMVVLSGYPCDLYDRELFANWHRVECKALADGARDRVEVLWINPNAWGALRNRTASLFERVAA